MLRKFKQYLKGETTPLSDERKKYLFSSTTVWMDRVYLLNKKSGFYNSEFQKTVAMSLEKRMAYFDERRAIERSIISNLRKLYPNDLAVNLYVDLSHVTIPDIHILCLALEHLYQAVRRLQKTFEPEAKTAARRFIKSWKKVRSLRNGLEHEEEYLAGCGKFKEMQDPNWMPPRIGASRQTQANEEGFLSIWVLGRQYNVKDCIKTVLELRSHLSKEMEKLTICESA